MLILRTRIFDKIYLKNSHKCYVTRFGVWTGFSRAWAFVAAGFIIVVPLVQEVLAVRDQVGKNKGRGTGGKAGEEENNAGFVKDGVRLTGVTQNPCKEL